MEMSGKDSYSVWRMLLKAILHNGTPLVDEEGRNYIELDNLTTTITSADNATKPITVINSLDTWVYPSLEEIEELMMNRNVNSEYRYSYGERLFGNKPMKNQIDGYVIPLLQSRSNSRRAVAVCWDPTQDSEQKNDHTAGIICIDFKIRSGKLDVSCLIRSNDMFFGWPANVYQMYIIQKCVSDKLGTKTGKISIFSTSAHVYENQKKYIQKIIK